MDTNESTDNTLTNAPPPFSRADACQPVRSPVTTALLDLALDAGHGGYRAFYFDPGSEGTEWRHTRAVVAASMVINIASYHAAYVVWLEVARVARDAGTPVLAIVGEGDRELGALAAETIEIADVPELASPILAVVPLQLLAYRIARLRGLNVDQPRNLAKTVTVE